MAANSGNIPKFGEWKTTDGGSPYTMYFENARKRKNNGGNIPEASPARMNIVPSGHRTPPRAAAAAAAAAVKPAKQQDGANRSRNQAKAGQGGTVPTWGQWNEGNSSGAGAQQYTIVFDQLREERRAPPTPGSDQLQRPTPNPPTHHDLYDHAPKVSKCCGLF